MKHLQRLALCFFYLVSTAVTAGGMGPACDGGSLTVPCKNQGFGFGAQALYLTANLPNLAYYGSSSDGTARMRHEYFLKKGFSYGFGFEVEGFYHFGRGKDLNLNWYHYNHNSQQTIPDTNDTISVYDTLFTGTVTTQLKPKWDAVNLEFGQRIDIQTWGNVRFHGGLQYANLTMHNITTGTGVFLNYGQSRTNYSSYEGIGPRAGADLSFDLRRDITLYLNGAAAILSGQNSFEREAITYLAPGSDNYHDINSGSANEIGTEVEYKLGASYTHPLAKGSLQLNAGWMLVNYYSVIIIADSFHNGRTKESNFAVQGAFAGLKWTGELG